VIQSITDEYDAYLDRLLDRSNKEKGVTFEEFRQFCQFLNNLEDFSIAMRMYTLADRAISKEEFARAVKICVGSPLSQHLIDVVFAIFDEDGDGLLSYKEFVAIMKVRNAICAHWLVRISTDFVSISQDRLHRGFKVSNFIIVDDLYNESDGDGFRFFSSMRSRACRHLVARLMHLYSGI